MERGGATLGSSLFTIELVQASFAQKKGWVQCLQEVHRHNWNKWRLIKHSYPLEPGQEEQEPGYIPQAVLDALKPKVDSLGKVVRYTKK